MKMPRVLPLGPLVCLLALAATPGSGWAQVSASISGTVEDPSGAGVRDTKITVKNLETGTTRTTLTDETGHFSVLFLAVGPHEARAAKPGFKTAVRTGVQLAVGQQAVVRLRLDLGDLAQEVTVAADTSMVNITTAPISGLVGEREVKDLPLNGRSFDNLITLNPGTVNYSAMKSAQTSTSDGSTFSVAGRRTSENLFLINGVEYTGASQLAVTPGGVSGELLGTGGAPQRTCATWGQCWQSGCDQDG